MHFYHILVQKAMLPREISTTNYNGCCIKHLKLYREHLMHSPSSRSLDAKRTFKGVEVAQHSQTDLQ